MKSFIYKLSSAMAAVALTLTFAACSGVEGGPVLPKIAVTIVPQADFVKAVCGDNFDVVTLIPPGYSPESYEP